MTNKKLIDLESLAKFAKDFNNEIDKKFNAELEIKADKSELFSGDYNDLTNKPSIPSIEGLATENYVDEKIEDIDLTSYVKTVNGATPNEDGNVIIPAVSVGSDEPMDNSVIWIDTDEETEELQIATLNTLTLGIHADGMLYIFSDNQPVGRGVQLGFSDAPILGYVDSENNVILSGNLYNGNYTIKYETEDGALIDIGSLTLEELESPPTETNYFDIKTALLNHRLSSTGNPSAFNGMLVTDYIPVNSTMYGQRFWINGVTLINSSSYNYNVRIIYCDTAKNMIEQSNYVGEPNEHCYYIPPVPSVSYAEGYEGYIRISLVLKDNEELSESDVSNLNIYLGNY